MSWSTPGTTPQPSGAPAGFATDPNGVNWNIFLNDTGYVDGYAAARDSLADLLDAISALPGWSVGGSQGYGVSASNYTP